jgi:hypothetical protein
MVEGATQPRLSAKGLELIDSLLKVGDLKAPLCLKLGLVNSTELSLHVLQAVV